MSSGHTEGGRVTTVADGTRDEARDSAITTTRHALHSLSVHDAGRLPPSALQHDSVLPILEQTRSRMRREAGQAREAEDAVPPQLGCSARCVVCCISRHRSSLSVTGRARGRAGRREVRRRSVSRSKGVCDGRAATTPRGRLPACERQNLRSPVTMF